MEGEKEPMTIPKIVILGAGYGGLMTAVYLQRDLQYNEAEVLLVNKHDYHYMKTALHEPAAGTTPQEAVKVNISEIINTDLIHFRKGTVEAIYPKEKRVVLQDGEIDYDYLVIALGSDVETFGIQGLKEHAFGITSLNSVRLIREHIERTFSRYAAEGEDEANLTIVVGGAGFTGIEFVGELADRIPFLCKKYHVPMEKVKIINIEAAPTVLPGFDQELVDYAVDQLQRKGVRFLLNTPIKACTEESVELANGDKIRSKTVIWTGGVRGNRIVEEAGFEAIRGRVKVDATLRAPGYTDVFVIGDASVVFNAEGRPYPPTAQIAVQQGVVCAHNLIALIRGGRLQPFVPHIQGTLASLGRKTGVGIVGKIKLKGGTALWMKKASDLRYLYKLGGVPLVIKKGRLFG